MALGAPRWPKIADKMTPEIPKDGSKTARNVPKWCLATREDSNKCSKTALDSSSWPKHRSRWPQIAPRWPKNAHKLAQDTPKMAQEMHKMVPKVAKTAPRRHQDVPKRP